MRGKEIFMKRKYTNLCRYLRKNQTDAERKLWIKLRDRRFEGIKFRRQYSVEKFILDFYCPKYKIGIEIDGGHHYEEKKKQRDELRTYELNKKGIEIIRFSDKEILTNIKEVFEVIYNAVKKRKETLSPSP